MINALFWMWVVSSTGIPTMSVHQSFEDKYFCEKEVHRLEMEYYRDRLPHKADINGERYYLKCMTNDEVIAKLQELNLGKVY